MFISAIRITFKKLFTDVRGAFNTAADLTVPLTCAGGVCIAAGGIAANSKSQTATDNMAAQAAQQTGSKVGSPAGANQAGVTNSSVYQ